MVCGCMHVCMRPFAPLFFISSSSSSTILQLTKSPECSDCKVFATDTILATLMTCARSSYSWDIVVQVDMAHTHKTNYMFSSPVK